MSLQYGTALLSLRRHVPRGLMPDLSGGFCDLGKRGLAVPPGGVQVAVTWPGHGPHLWKITLFFLPPSEILNKATTCLSFLPPSRQKRECMRLR